MNWSKPKRSLRRPPAPTLTKDGYQTSTDSQELLMTMETIWILITEKCQRDSSEMLPKKMLSQLINSPKIWSPTTLKKEPPEEITQSQMDTSISLKLKPIPKLKKFSALTSSYAKLKVLNGLITPISTDGSTLGNTSMSWRPVKLMLLDPLPSSDTLSNLSDG